MIGLETIVECEEWLKAVPGIEALAARVHKSASDREPALGGAAALLLADDAHLRDLNRRFRKKDAPTNVLSFPSGETAPGFLGDVALAFGICASEASAARKPLPDHAAHLIAHGLLHLVGYDHETDAQALVMEAKEAEILAALGVENPYSET
ncbi:MAG: rRNA maturation RNase YbeY [Parvularculaceae bacterium]